MLTNRGKDWPGNHPMGRRQDTDHCPFPPPPCGRGGNLLKLSKFDYEQANRKLVQLAVTRLEEGWMIISQGRLPSLVGGQEGLMVVPVLNCPSTWYWCWSTSVPNGPGGHHLNACKVSPTGPWCVHFDFDNSGVVNDIPLLMIETFQPTYIYFYCKFARWERLCHIDVGIEHFLSDTVR